MKAELIERIAATFEMCGGPKLSAMAKELVIEALEDYSEAEIITALEKCVKEVQSGLTLAHIIQRIPKKQNERPSADSAWSMIPFAESESAVWTEEMAQAWSQANNIYDSDPVGARMAFRSEYERLCLEAESKGIPPKWTVSLGTWEAGRERALKDAVEKGRLTYKHAKTIMPMLDVPNTPADLSPLFPTGDVLPQTDGPESFKDIYSRMVGSESKEGESLKSDDALPSNHQTTNETSGVLPQNSEEDNIDFSFDIDRDYRARPRPGRRFGEFFNDYDLTTGEGEPTKEEMSMPVWVKFCKARMGGLVWDETSPNGKRWAEKKRKEEEERFRNLQQKKDEK